MALAADGLHPSFSGGSIRSWNLYNSLLDLRRLLCGEWQDYALPPPAREPQQVATYAQVETLHRVSNTRLAK